MAAELSMNGRKKIETIQKEFTNKFNYLTLLFLDEDRKSLDISKSLSEVRKIKGTDISINAGLKVNTLEARFRDNYGLMVEVAYMKDGKVLHTKDNVDKTLNEMNRWCEENGCDKFEFKKSLRGDTVLSLQEQLFNAISEQYPDAVAKKMNKDNFMDVHLPSVNAKKGTHIFFNTAKEGIKFGFYCRDEAFVKSVLDNSSNIEAYAQGLRPLGNPLFTDVDEAADAALAFIGEMMGEASVSLKRDVNPVIAEYVSAFQENPDPICDLLDSLGTEAGKMSVYKVDLDILSNLAFADIPDADDLEFVGEVDINDWDGLAEIIGEEEAEANKNEYSNDELTSSSKIIFLYSGDEYVYSFLNPGGEEDGIDSIDNDDEDIDNTEDDYQSDTEIKSVKIGNQEWMAENLNVDKFRNGDLIPEVKSQNEWEKAGKSGKPAWCYYDNNNINGEKYGKLYNWYAVNDPRGLAPEGWHIPSDEEWDQLAAYLGGEDDAGKKMKTKTGWDGSEDWPEGNGTDEYGFSGLPGGLRTHIGEFIKLGKYTSWWTSTESDTEGAWDRSLYYAYGNFDRGDNYGGEGLNVRCLKD